MKVSDKIKQLKKLGKLIVKEEGNISDFVMIGLEYTNKEWHATLIFDGCGDGYPSLIYVDNEHKAGDDNEVIMCGISKSIIGALNKLEKKMYRYLGTE
jgi:hypothetical protein